jgi:hypothetical protein
MKFLLTIDTEADNQWDHGAPLTTRNIEFVPRFQDVCNSHHIKPTYFVTSEVCENVLAREIFTQYRINGQAEIGSHLHAWTTPPFPDRDGFRFNDPHHAFATELPPDVLRAKLSFLTSQVEASFGKRPVTFRSGRYGFNEEVARALVELGYVADSSVTPFTSWASFKGSPGGTGGPDFMACGNQPCRVSTPAGSLLEIPVTILPTRWPLSAHHPLARTYFKQVDHSLPLKIVRKLFFADQPLWLRPNKDSTVALFSRLIREAKKLQIPYLVMMFHSSELMPGGSPYWKNENEIGILYKLLEEFFSWLNAEHIESITMEEASIEPRIRSQEPGTRGQEPGIIKL